MGDAGAYRWSSAAAHLGGGDETGLLDLIAWREQMPAERWRERLLLPEDDDLLHTLRLTTTPAAPSAVPPSSPITKTCSVSACNRCR